MEVLAGAWLLVIELSLPSLVVGLACLLLLSSFSFFSLKISLKTSSFFLNYKQN